MSCKIFPDESYEKSPSLKAFVLMIKNVLNVKIQCGSPPWMNRIEFSQLLTTSWLVSWFY